MHLILLGPCLAFILMTNAMEVPYGGSQHLLLVQQEYIIACNSLLMSEEGVLLCFTSIEKKKKSLVSSRIYLFKERALLLSVTWLHMVQEIVMIFKLYSLHATEIYIIILFFHMLQLVVFYFRSNFKVLLPLPFSAYCFLAKTRHFIPNYYDFNLCCNWHHVSIYPVVYMYE